MGGPAVTSLPRRERYIDAAAGVDISVALLEAFGLDKGFLWGVVVIANLILLCRVVQPDIDQINLHVDSNVWVGKECVINRPSDWVLYLKRQKGRKAVEADDLFRAWKSLRNVKLPLTINFGGRSIAVIVECCDKGELNMLSVSRTLDFHATPDSWRALRDGDVP